IEFNGVRYPITWVAQNSWTARVPVNAASNLVTILGYDQNGQLVSGASNRVTIQLGAPLELAQGNIVINELMFRGAVPDAEYIELYNGATNTKFDLSGWLVNVLDYMFSNVIIITPRCSLVL